jgi:hypothetical protein
MSLRGQDTRALQAYLGHKNIQALHRAGADEVQGFLARYIGLQGGPMTPHLRMISPHDQGAAAMPITEDDCVVCGRWPRPCAGKFQPAGDSAPPKPGSGLAQRLSSGGPAHMWLITTVLAGKARRC